MVKVDDPSGVMAISRIEWRRPDRGPEKKAVLVVDLKSGKGIPNSFSRNISAMSGEVYFQPVSGVGEYAVYFLPVRIEGGAFPVSRYLLPRTRRMRDGRPGLTEQRRRNRYAGR